MSDINHAALVERQEEGKLHPMFNLLIAAALTLSVAERTFPEPVKEFKAAVVHSIDLIRPLSKTALLNLQKD